MKRIIAVASFLALFVGAALAADNAMVLTPGTGVTERSKDVGSGVQSVLVIPGDTSGNSLATAPGTGNTVFALPIQGVTGGTAVPVSLGSVPLPTGAATSALQTTGNTSLASLVTNLGTIPYDGSGYLEVNVKAGGVYNSASPTLTPGQQASLQLTVAGSLHTTVDNGNSNGQATMANSSPVVLASNQSVADPCTFQAKSNAAISTASGTTAVVTGVSAKKIYVCSFALIAPSAVSVSLSEGSSSTCGTSSQAAVIGVATNGTAANGMSLAANGGLTLGNGTGTIAVTATAANYLCLFQSGTAQLAGNLTYVQQ